MSEPTIALKEDDIAPDDVLFLLHIPKTAGTTLKSLIDPMWHPGARCPGYHNGPFVRQRPEELKTYRSFVGHLYYRIVEPYLPNGAVSITVLREPAARYVSDFLHLQRTMGVNGFKLRGLTEIRSMSLEHFMDQTQLPKVRESSNLQTRMLGVALPLEALAQKHPIAAAPTTDQDLESAKQTLATMTTFGLTERLPESLWMLSFIFGWYPLRNERWLNAAPHASEKPTLPPPTRKQVEAVNQHDLALYQFATDLFEQRARWLMQTLLARYGTREQRQMALPLPPETIEQLLETHYYARAEQRSGRQIPARRYHFTFDRTAESATGWHERELAPQQGTYRWTGPTRTSSLLLPVPFKGELQLRFRVLHVVKPYILDALRVSANGTPLKWTRAKDAAGVNVYHAVIPKRVVGSHSFVHLEWHVPETVKPCEVEPGNMDARELGLMMHWVELEATTAHPNENRIHPIQVPTHS